MSRKRSHTSAFAISTDGSENGIYLLPGCYYCPQLECSMCEECCSDGEAIVVDDSPHVNAFTGNGLYIADACGNIFYNSDLGYVICEEIVCYSGLGMEGDDFSDPGSEYDNKRTRSNISSDEEEINNITIKEPPGYIVEEPPDEEDTKAPRSN